MSMSMQEFVAQLKGDFTAEQAHALRSFNQQLTEEFREKEGQISGDFAGAPLLLLTTVGAKSGKEHTTPLVYSQDGDRYVVIASKAGLDKHPAWYFNLLAHPQTKIEIGAQPIPVKAALAEGSERQRLFEQQAALMPVFHDYQRKTTRELPVFILTPA
jgi:deazaflavin-dependent oxidoreductase (nitroreductase family)